MTRQQKTRVMITVTRTEESGEGSDKKKNRDSFRFSTDVDGTKSTETNIKNALHVAGLVALGDLTSLEATEILNAQQFVDDVLEEDGSFKKT